MSPVHESRRKFLLDSATAASGLFLGGIYSIGNAGSATQLGKVIGPGKGKNPSTGDDLYFIGIYDLDDTDGKVRTISNIGFLAMASLLTLYMQSELSYSKSMERVVVK